MQTAAAERKFGGRQLSFRIGINSGPVVAGVIGRKKFIYDLWGEAVSSAVAPIIELFVWSRGEVPGSASRKKLTVTLSAGAVLATARIVEKPPIGGSAESLRTVRSLPAATSNAAPRLQWTSKAAC
jgi:hypothetical protein